MTETSPVEMAPADDSGDMPRSSTAVQKRSEQLKRWLESDTNKENSDPKDKKRKVAFQDDCVFLAACAAGDKDEVQRLLSRGSDINTANVDGLTALHQACIDDRIDMVTFLIDRGADINRGDNEGWTPLHATSSCGYLSIAKLLIDRGGRVDIVNNDGELPIDIADTDEMESLLQAEVYRQGINLDSARSEEEQLMLRDVKQWFNGTVIQEPIHPKTCATPLHVAAAKGYHDVMRMLIDLGVDINPVDVDGWTPFHAAAHWGHREGCQLLVEYGCDVDCKAKMGQTVLDLCEPDLTGFVEDLIKRQPALIRENSVNIENRLRRQQQRSRQIITSPKIPSDKTSIQTKEVLIHRAPAEPLRSALSEAKSCDTVSGVPQNPPDGGSEKLLSQKPSASTPAMASSPYQSRTATTSQPSPVVASDAKDVPIKPISFLPPTSEKPVESKLPLVRMEKPISFLQPTEVKPISFLQPQLKESPFPLTSKISSGTGEPAKAETAAKPFTGISFLRDDSKTPKPEPSALVSSPKSASSAASQKFAPASSFAPNNKPLLSDLPSFEYIDNTSLPNSPNTDSQKVPDAKDRSPKRVAPDWPPRPPNSEYYKPLTHTQPMPSRKVLPTETNNVSSVTPQKSTVSSVFFGITTTPTPESPTATEPNNTATVRRSFQPPARDEESEAQRKAHAKRIRETRRSTQGVSADDLKQADAQVKSQSSGGEKLPSATPCSPVFNLSSLDSSRDDEKENESKQTAPLTRLATVNVDNSRLLNPDNGLIGTRPLTLPPSSPEAVITLPLRKSKTDEDNDDQKNTRRRRPKRRSTGVVNLDMEDEEGSASGTDILEPVTFPDAVQQNGLVPTHNNGVQSNSSTTPSATDRSYPRSKYETSAERAPTSRTSRTSSISSASSTIIDKEEQENTDQDWKKLYEQEKAENEKLRKKLESTEKELTETKADVQKVVTNSGKNVGSLSEIEKRERRALERKIAELEEELKELETLRADNQRLKEENGALIRVISKLSK